jgi:phage terminase large subunit GpA-like protein
MDMLTSRQHESVIFVGPQRTGKTQALLDCWLNYAVAYDPSDMMFMFSGQDLARDYSLRRVDRMIANNPELRRRLISGQGDNVHDKRFMAGNIINFAWASINQLRQRDLRFAAVSELDSIKTDIGGSGEVFGLLKKRTQTALSGGMTLAEGAPSKPVNVDIEFRPASDHEAMPADGLAKLYNEGDRRRLYWQCLHCSELFQASMRYLKWTEEENLIDTSETVALICPHCGGLHTPKDKQTLNTGVLDGRGGWFKQGELEGKPIISKSATFWMEGVAAGFQSWQEIIYNQLAAIRAYEATGNYDAWKTTVNSDQGLQFVPPTDTKKRDVDRLSSRAEDGEKRVLPLGVRFLTAAIDQQKNRFVVQVQGWGIDGECWIIDRYNILDSERIGEDGKKQKIEPSSYSEDWHKLVQVLTKTYRTTVGTDMPIQGAMFDIGGMDKATENAYYFYNYAMKIGLSDKVYLVKGSTSIKSARYERSKSESRKSKYPLWLVNSNGMKDEVSRQLDRDEHGAGYVHFPKWLGQWFYDELAAEKKQANGAWVKVKAKSNNEAFDLMAYNRVMALILGLERIDWDSPPAWARLQSQEQSVQVDDLDWLKQMANDFK